MKYGENRYHKQQNVKVMALARLSLGSTAVHDAEGLTSPDPAAGSPHDTHLIQPLHTLGEEVERRCSTERGSDLLQRTLRMSSEKERV